MHVILKYMKAMISYEGIQRIERYFVPDAALREALLNALCHKQYESGVPIQISVYEDRLYIANCGRLPDDWTADHLMKKHPSRPYNPSIANVFYLAGLIESWGRGVEKICQTCEADGAPLPEYTVHPGDIMIKFTAAEEVTSTSGTTFVPENVPEKVTEKERPVFLLLQSDPSCTSQFMADMLSVSRKTISRRLESMKKKGIIERMGSDTKGYWKINQ